MGIPYYFNHIIKSYPKIIQRKALASNLRVYNFFLDSNSIIYDIVHKNAAAASTTTPPLTNEKIIQLVIQKIEYYIQAVNPENIVFIAFDGVAPLGKMVQQRTRRFKSMYSNNIRTFLENVDGDSAVDKSKNSQKSPQEKGFDTVQITPGTNFMKQLSESVSNHFSQNSRIIVSASDVPGEGEHKIFRYMRDKHTLNKTSVVYGLDADLIMLSMNHLYTCGNIFLLREAPHLFPEKFAGNSKEDELYLVDIGLLSEKLPVGMKDYVFLCFLLGNDFLPHFPAINIRTGGVDKALESYLTVLPKGGILEKSTTRSDDSGKIHWKSFYKLISDLASKEEEFLRTEYKLRNKMEKQNNRFSREQDKKKTKYEIFEMLPIFEREQEKYIDPFEPGWQERYYKCLFGMTSSSVTEEKKKQICLNYLTMLEWCSKYYSGECPDWRLSYDYHYPPLLEDLVKYIPNFNKNFIKPLKKANPVSPTVQLVYVLPKENLHLLPEQLRIRILEKHAEWYNDDPEFTWSFCKYFWEGHIDLPRLSIKEIEDFIEDVNK